MRSCRSPALARKHDLRWAKDSARTGQQTLGCGIRLVQGAPMGLYLRVALLFLVLLGLYLVFAGEVSTVELIAGSLAALAATGLGVALVVVAKRHFRVARPVKAVLSPLPSLLTEFFKVGRELVVVALRGASGQQGSFVHQPFEPGGEDAASAGRRAATILGISVAPGS